MDTIRQLEAELRKLKDDEKGVRARLQEAKQKYYIEFTARYPVIYTLQVCDDNKRWYDYYHDFDYTQIQEVRHNHKKIPGKRRNYQVIVHDTEDYQHLISDIGKIVSCSSKVDTSQHYNFDF